MAYNLVNDVHGVEVHQDNVIVLAPDQATYDARVLKRIHQGFNGKNVVVVDPKCSFPVANFEYLGYLVNADAFRPDPRRLATSVNKPSPQNLSELHSLLGVLQFYTLFVSNISQQAPCLFQMVSQLSFEESTSH